MIECQKERVGVMRDGIRAPRGSAVVLHHPGPRHHRRRPRPFRGPRLRRGQCRRRCAGRRIARRTLFRYYASKNAIPWATSTPTSTTCATCWTTWIPTCRSVRRCARRCWPSTSSARRRRRGTGVGCGSSWRRRHCRRSTTRRRPLFWVGRRVRGPPARGQGGRSGPANRGLDRLSAWRCRPGYEALVGRPVGVVGAGTGRCVRHGQRWAADTGPAGRRKDS